ncbi:MAG: TetR/AcrR family transcriptional regulator [bacterium]|nr:TetR/AcrR family transcriptional regulator [bacterium]
MGKSEDTRNKIIHAAVSLAKKQGPEKVSVKDIYEEAGISKNTFYQYFENKEGAFGGTFTTSDEEKVAALPEILLNFDSPLEQFWELSKIDIKRQMSFGPKLLGTIAMQNVLQNTFYFETEGKLSASVNITLSMIKKMQRSKEIHNMTDPFILLRTIYSAVIGIDIRWTKMEGKFDFKQEVYLQTMAILQPVKEISNYE